MKILLLLFGLMVCSLSIPIEFSPQMDHHYLSHFSNHITSLDDDPSKACTMCKSVVVVAHMIMKMGKGIGILKTAARFICERFTSKQVCSSGVEEYATQVWQILAAGLIKPEQLCGMIFGNTCAHISPYYPEWNITVPSYNTFTPKSSNIGKNTGGQTEAGFSKILHISDTHIDNDYMEGAHAICPDPLCCRKQNGRAEKGEATAGKYGYAGFCDSNHVMLHNMFQHIQANHKNIEYIYWTGDVPPHNVWNQSQSDQISAIKQAAGYFRQYFPGKRVFPCVGNHESVPVDFFAPPEIWDWSIPSTEWLFNALAEEWNFWLKDAKAVETIRKGGYYTTLITKGLRLVSLNTNYGHKENFWLAVMSVDPAHQLAWLIDVLLASEKEGEKVHIIGHVPPGDRLEWWDYNYYRVVERFQHTITGQFFGHTHHDEFRVFYDMKTFRTPVQVAYLSPSVTTFHDLNPGYRVYEVDVGSANSSMSVIDHQTFILDLAKVNKGGKAEFELEYSAKSSYKMADLSPSSWEDVLVRMEGDDALFQIMYYAFTKQHVLETCHFGCRVNYICVMRTAWNGRDFCEMDAKGKVMFEAWKAKTYDKC